MANERVTGPQWACPRCGDTPTDPRNEQWEWCERCQGYTAIENPNPAIAWTAHVGGDLDGAWREYELRTLVVGDEFQPDGSSDVYRWTGTEWTYARDAA